MNENNLVIGEELCKECGLCCQGIFHTFAYLNNDNDIRIAKKENILVKHNKPYNINYFSLPCSAFTNLCSIYPERPSVCSAHKCDLLNTLISNQSTLEDSLKRVRELKIILASLLPELQILAKNTQTNNPKTLMESINSQLNDEHFKKQHTKTYLDFAVFCFLVEKYFYFNTDSY